MMVTAMTMAGVNDRDGHNNGQLCQRPQQWLTPTTDSTTAMAAMTAHIEDGNGHGNG